MDDLIHSSASPILADKQGKIIQSVSVKDDAFILSPSSKWTQLTLLEFEPGLRIPLSGTERTDIIDIFPVDR